jgi:hypothetical protein
MVDRHIINFNLIGLGDMGALVWVIIIIFWLLIQIVQWLDRKATIKGSKVQQPLDRFRAKIQKQKQEKDRQNKSKFDGADDDFLNQKIREKEKKQQAKAKQDRAAASAPIPHTPEQEERIRRAESLIKQAKSNIDRDTELYNPFDSDLLLAAIEFYHQSYLLINKESCTQAIDSLQIEIARRQEFQSLFRIATKQFYDKQFGQALTTLFLAQALYSPNQLVKAIADCEENAKLEKVYLASLAEAKILSYAGEFSHALQIVELATAKFTRQDGEDLQVSLNRVIAAKKQLILGDTKQKAGDILAAKEDYLSALYLMPEWTEPKLKLAILNAQAGENRAAIDLLTNINFLQAKSLEGLLYTQTGEYQRAREIWSKLDPAFVREYWKLISNETIEQCRLIQPQIKQLVDRGELVQARTMSLEFIRQFGSDSLIESNLTNCIIPGIESKIWQTEDWQRIAVLTHENWVSQPSIKSLHNWAISLYYSTQIDDNIEKLITAWGTAIANLDIDPACQDSPWLGTNSLSLVEISDKLWKLLEQRIEAVKDADLSKYLYLRDRYRQEFWAMKLARQDRAAKITIGEIVILPACYQQYYSQISLGEQPEIWKTLYTNWGKAVAACLDGDLQRAEIIKVNLEIDSNLEEFANHLILYKQGCYHLQQEDWRSAIYPLNDAKNTIDRQQEWRRNIDELCGDRRQQIYEFEEHLDFSRFWHDLVSSDRSENYLVEYQALKIQLDWSQSIVTDELSLSKIQDLRDAHPHHPVAQEIFTIIYQYWLNN